MVSIVHLGKFYPPAPGGIETHLQTLARSQAALNANVRVICVNHADRTGGDVTWSRFRKTASTEEADGSVRISRTGRIASLARLDVCPQLLGQLRQLRNSAVDVVHLHTPNPTMLLAWLASGLRLPLVITHHSDIIKQRLLRHLLSPFEAKVYSHAGRILADSPVYAAGSSLLKNYPTKVESLPLGIDLRSYLQPSASALKLAQEFREKYPGPRWLMVGRLIYYKGISLALQALRDVPGTLIVVGTGPMASTLRQQALELGVSNRVVWQGHLDPQGLIGAYHSSTALWFPSIARSEAFGLVQVEAMASACPVINSAIPHSGVSWVSLHEETGLTVPVNDAPALAAAARRLLDNPDLRDRLGSQARQRALAEFSQEKMAQRSLEIYRSLPRPA